MTVSSMNIAFQDGQLHVQVHGSGPRLLICLHGYGNTGSIFDFLKDQLPAGVRMVALDLPGFGKSESTTGDQTHTIPQEAWNHLLTNLRSAFPETEEIMIVAFSIGARIGLHWMSQGHLPISKMILIAPDGLRLHPLYRFCVKNPVGRALFRLTMRYPGPFLLFLRMFHKLRGLDKARYRYVQGQLAPKAERERLLYVWLGYAGLEKNLHMIRERTQDWGTEWHLIWGEKDRVVKPKWGRQFVERMPGAQLTLLRGGHTLLSPPSKKLKATIDNLLKEK